MTKLCSANRPKVVKSLIFHIFPIRQEIQWRQEYPKKTVDCGKCIKSYYLYEFNWSIIEISTSSSYNKVTYNTYMYPKSSYKALTVYSVQLHEILAGNCNCNGKLTCNGEKVEGRFQRIHFLWLVFVF